MGEREITNAQFRQFKESHNSGAVGKFSLDLDKQPVSRVTWERGRGVLQLAVAAGRPAAGVQAERGRRVHADRAGEQRLSPAHRSASGNTWRAPPRTGKPLKYPWGEDLPVVSGTANIAGSRSRSGC